MQESEWGDPLFSSDGEADSPAAAAAASSSSFCCACSRCEQHEPLGAAAASKQRGREGAANHCSSSQGPLQPAHSGAARPHENAISSSSSRYTEGVPVSVMMLQYPLFFCEVDLPFTLELKRSWREIGGLAFWALSSAKEGASCNGVEALRDNNSQTFWQSEGLAPHTVTLQFNKEMAISRVDLLVNLQQDESYTPKRVQIKLGSSPSALHVVRDVEFALAEEQSCWWGIELTPLHALKVPVEFDAGGPSHASAEARASRGFDYFPSFSCA
ncbi:hypothetical protein Efla_005039 [Eimeria flavescens]